MTTEVVVGADGLARCPWAASTPDYLAYHDEEWGRVVRGEQPLFERLSLEAFQSGLSWITILRKRPAFRAAFADFDPEAVAAFGDGDVVRLMADTGIVRNKAKIGATISNARIVLDLRSVAEPTGSAGPIGPPGPPGLDALIWSHAPPPTSRPVTSADVPAVTAESTALSRELRRRGMRFVGPTTAYALMQACGLVDDHLAACHVAPRSPDG